MTDEERQKLLDNLRMVEFAAPTYAKQWCGKAADEIERLAKELAEAVVYAEQLAISLAARWYPEVPQWKPLKGDLIGLLTQIDNMSTGAVRAQSDAEPPPKHPIGFDDKPMTDWYYDDDGVCQPSRAADRSGK